MYKPAQPKQINTAAPTDFQGSNIVTPHLARTEALFGKAPRHDLAHAEANMMDHPTTKISNSADLHTRASEVAPVIQQRAAMPLRDSIGQVGATYERHAATDGVVQRKVAAATQPRPTPIAPRNNTGLPDRLKTGIESLSGISMDHVRVHYNSPQPAQVSALAYAQGSEIHIAPGQERHLPHEAWHIVQQAQNRVKPTLQMKGGASVNDDGGLEHEADVMGARALAGRLNVAQRMDKGSQGVKTPLDFFASAPTHSMPIQCISTEKQTHRHNVKKGIDPEEAQEKRRDETKKISKQKRADMFKNSRERSAPIISSEGFPFSPPLPSSLSSSSSSTIDHHSSLSSTSSSGFGLSSGFNISKSSEPSMELEDDLPYATTSSNDLDMEDQTQNLESLAPAVEFTDKEGKNHSVYLNLEAQGLIVKSNPKPLKTIIAERKWEKIGLIQADLDVLGQIQKEIENELKSYGRNRSKNSGNKLRLELNKAANILSAISKIPIPPTNLTGSTNYLSNTFPTEAKKVVAKPLSLQSTTSGSGPRKEGRLVTALREKEKAGKQQRSSYIQMHLLNDNIFGPGELWNLTPGPVASNNNMAHIVETILKQAIIDKGVVMTFEAEVNYKKDPMGASNKDIKDDPDKYCFTDIAFKATQWVADSTTKTYKEGHNINNSVKGVDKEKVKWMGSKLPSLVPKPHILSTHDPEELKRINGISPAAAENITDYNKNHSAYTISGKNKKEALATLINKSGATPKLNLKKLHANDVLWR
jgi:hypothetical protein